MPNRHTHASGGASHGQRLRLSLTALCLILALTADADAQQRPASRRSDPSGFPWPGGARVALSLTFDDGRSSQVTHGLPLLDSLGVKATFYVMPEAVREDLAGWRRVVASGHEIGNHTMDHPCTGNFTWVRYDGVALENYDLAKMRAELVQANDEIEALLGVRPTSFAYPCGQTFVGRGRDTRSYVPLVAELFHSGRRWMDETSNAPYHVDLAQVTALRMDGEDFASVRRMVERTERDENWLVLAGHNMGESPRRGTDLQMLRELVVWARQPDSGVWIATVSEVARRIEATRQASP